MRSEYHHAIGTEMGLLLMLGVATVIEPASLQHREPSSPTQTQAAPESSGDGTSSPPQKATRIPWGRTLPHSIVTLETE